MPPRYLISRPADRPAVSRKGALPQTGVGGALASFALVVLLLGAAPGALGHAAAGPRPGHAPPPLTFPGPLRHVYVVYFENEELSSVQQNAPFMEYLAHRYASASNYYGLCHPSAPNYLAGTSGATWQCGSDNWNTYSSENIFDLAQKAGLSWNDFSESMPQPCYTSDTFPNGLYVAHHNPAVFYSDIVNNQTRCKAHDLSFSAWNGDVTNGTLPNFAVFAPNMNDDGHQTGTAYADTWLKGWLSPYLNDTWFSTTAWIIVFDEGTTNAGYNGSYGGHIFLTAVSPYSLGGKTVSRNADHYDLLATEEWLLGLRVGGCGRGDNSSSVRPLTGLFNFTNTTPPPLTVRAAANTTGGPPPLDVGFDAQVTGAAPPVRYSWSFGDGATSDLATPNHTYRVEGNFSVRLNVTDALGRNGTGNLTIRVSNNSTGPPPLTLSITAAPRSGPAPLAVQYTAWIAGGTPPYNVTWSSGQGARSYGTTASFTFPVAGNFTAVAVANDSAGLAATANLSVTVYAPLVARVSVAPSPVVLGGQIVAKAAPLGGPPGAVYSYSWTVNGTPFGGNVSQVTYTPTRPGTVAISVAVSDAQGDHSMGWANASVLPTGSPPGNSSPASTSWWLPVGVAVVVVLVAATGLLLWRRRRGPAPP